MQTASLPAKKQSGRPTKYNPDILRKAKEYLESYRDKGDMIPNQAGMAVELGITRETLITWGKDKNKSKFSYILKQLKQLQERVLLSGGLDSSLNTTITKMVLTKHGYHDNPQQNQASSGIQVTINRDSVVLRSGSDTLEVSDTKGQTLEHDPD